MKGVLLMGDIERPKYRDNWTWFTLGLFLFISGLIWLAERNFYSNLFKTIIFLGMLSLATGFIHTKYPSKKEDKKSIEEPTDNNIRSAHLDFYSTSAMTNAQISVACIFGLFTALTLIDQSKSLNVIIFSSIAFWGLYIGGLYCALNFYHFWHTAFIVRGKMTEYDYENEQEQKAKQNKNPIIRSLWSVFYKIKNNYVLPCAIIVYLLILFIWFALLI